MKPFERHSGVSRTEPSLAPEARTTFSWTRSKCTVAADARSEVKRVARHGRFQIARRLWPPCRSWMVVLSIVLRTFQLGQTVREYGSD